MVSGPVQYQPCQSPQRRVVRDGWHSRSVAFADAGLRDQLRRRKVSGHMHLAPGRRAARADASSVSEDTRMPGPPQTSS
jgi:hypothetical protein